MPSKEEKERRRKLMEPVLKKAAKDFEKGLPMDRASFKELFDFLDKAQEGCDHTLRQTDRFLTERGIGNKEEVFAWLRANGGYCDCEVLANVEEMFV